MLAAQTQPHAERPRHSSVTGRAGHGTPSAMSRSNLDGLLNHPPVWQNGRQYQGFRPGKYPFPCDEFEKHRLDFMHYALRELALNQGPVTPRLHDLLLHRDSQVQVLDLGCGTGIWCLDVQDFLEEEGLGSKVIGVELVDIMPHTLVDRPFPSAVSWLAPMDFEDFNWEQKGLRTASFNLINMSCLRGAIADWRSFYRQVYRYLKAGIGQIQHFEIDFTPRSNDPNAPSDSLMHEWWRLLRKATAGRPLEVPDEDEQNELLRQAGFVDIILSSTPLPWHSKRGRDRPFATIGSAMQITLESLEDQFFESFMMAPFTRVLGWSPADVRDFGTQLRAFVHDAEWSGYFVLKVYTARRPGFMEGPPATDQGSSRI